MSRKAQLSKYRLLNFYELNIPVQPGEETFSVPRSSPDISYSQGSPLLLICNSIKVSPVLHLIFEVNLALF